MKKVIFLALLVLAPFALAQDEPCSVDTLVFEPNPVYSDDTNTEVTLTGSCVSTSVPFAPVVTVFENEIEIELQRSRDELTLPTVTPWGERVSLPMLAAGTYNVTVTSFFGLDLFAEQTLVVRDRPAKVTPAFGGELTEAIIEGYEAPVCTVGSCPITEIFFGNARATNVRRGARGEWLVTVPAGSGVVDVRIVNGPNIVTVDDAFRYGGAFQDDLDRVLFPVNLMTPGAHGSEWRTDLVVRNDGPVTIETQPLFWSDPASPILPIPQPIAPGGKGNFIQRTRDGGEFLYTPRGLESRLSYASHVVDRSRSAVDLGTEVPVVREEDTDYVVKLLEVPVDSRYRAKLRVYDLDTNGREVVVTLTDPNGGTSIQRPLALTGISVCPVAPCISERPAFAVLDLEQIPELRDMEDGVDVTITARTNDARLWGFVTVTNNDTQHVTVYTPQHRRRPR
jgi:hypothetical protein